MLRRSKRAKKEWTPDAYLKSAFRKIWRWSPQRRECLKGTSCVSCRREIPKEIKRADHISPVVDPKYGFVGWDEYYRRMFYGKLQLLCDTCHKVKTKAEGKQRREEKKKRKLAR